MVKWYYKVRRVLALLGVSASFAYYLPSTPPFILYLWGRTAGAPTTSGCGAMPPYTIPLDSHSGMKDCKREGTTPAMDGVGGGDGGDEDGLGGGGGDGGMSMVVSAKHYASPDSHCNALLL